MSQLISAPPLPQLRRVPPLKPRLPPAPGRWYTEESTSHWPSRTLLQSQMEVADSNLPARLYTESGHARFGVWMPRWLRQAVGSEAQALVLAEVLWWFETAYADRRRNDLTGKKDHQEYPRARCEDENRQMWFAASAAILARRTMLPPSTAKAALAACIRQGLLSACSGRNRVTGVRPYAKGLAFAFWNQTKNKTAHYEFLDEDNPQPVVEWHGSYTQMHAGRKAPGVTVHHPLIAIAKDPLQGRILSWLISKFNDRHGSCHTRCCRHGLLWWVTNRRRLADELGIASKSVERTLAALAAKQLILLGTAPYAHKQGVQVCAGRYVVGLMVTMDNKVLQDTHGENMLHLIPAVGYLKTLLASARVVRHLSQHAPETLTEFQKIVASPELHGEVSGEAAA